MEAIPMCQLLTIKTIKFQSDTSVLFIIKVVTCFDPTDTSGWLPSNLWLVRLTPSVITRTYEPKL